MFCNALFPIFSTQQGLFWYNYDFCTRYRSFGSWINPLANLCNILMAIFSKVSIPSSRYEIKVHQYIAIYFPFYVFSPYYFILHQLYISRWMYTLANIFPNVWFWYGRQRLGIRNIDFIVTMHGLTLYVLAHLIEKALPNYRANSGQLIDLDVHTITKSFFSSYEY